ncbi:MAG: glycosyltransferase family 39 protein [Gemmatimonadales bacterium]|nr:glycosyltransferase family 39 protein [Gemmatimonadales bacterium]
MSSSFAPRPLVLLLVCAALILRVVLALRPGIWGDEIFSLAMATGHSLEHPAAEARSALGDFVQPPGVEPSSTFRRYVEHQHPPAGPDRVIRAVRLSDTSPPLYYLLLNGWTRVLGTGDAALRFFSLLWAVLTLPLLWLLGRDVGGRAVGGVAVVLYAWSPPSVFYSVEGRMYSLVWLLATALAWQTLQLSRRGVRSSAAAAWLGIAAAGLYTHYFFLFVWLAFGAWLLAWPGRMSRPAAAALVAGSALAAAPWYLQVPESLSRWRVTGAWLSDPLGWPEIATRPFELAWSLLAGGSLWGGSPAVDALLALAYLLLALWIMRQGGLRELFSPDRLLVWAWVAAAVLGPYVFDLVRHTGASRIPRYVLSGLPAAMLLASLAIQQLRPRLRALFVGLVIAAWTAGLWPIVRQPSRPGAVYPALASELDRWAEPGDVVVVHSIPSGVIGLSRYLGRDLPLAASIEPLGLRQPDDLAALLAGRRRVALVQVHNIGQPSSAEPWLRTHRRLAGRRVYDGTRDALSPDLASLSPAMQAALAQHRLVEIFYFEPIEFEPIEGPSVVPARR